jgi:uncharacterized protein (DUF427 family)
MSLSSPMGRAPLEPAGRHTDVPLPERVRYWEPWPRRMRGVLGGRTVVDSRRAVMFWQTGAFPELYYPRADIRADLLDSRQLSPAPAAGGQDGDLADYVRVEFGAMDRWFEEDDPVYAHTRDPYHRVDVRASSRHVTVRHGDRVIADSVRPKLLFETGNPVRYYLPFADVDLALLTLSDTVSECPYKGDGQHWHLTAAGERIADAAWSLPHPLPESFPAAGHICFYPAKVHIEADGEHVTE